MAGSGSYARGDQPRPVPDKLKGPYEEVVRRQQAINAQQATSEAQRRAAAAGVPPTLSGPPMQGAQPPSDRRKFDHPGALESMIPIWGSGKEALADLEDRNYSGAAVNAALAASDVVLAKAILTGLAKGGLKLAGPHAWRTAPWEEPGMRKWLGQQGFLKPGQPGHHWLLKQSSNAPDWLKNQPPFIKGTRGNLDHGRMHGPYTQGGVRYPPYNPAELLWHETPQWAKAAYVSSAGHSGMAVGRAGADETELERRR